MKAILQFLASQVARQDSALLRLASRWLLHALGDKTSTAIGAVLTFLIAHYSDFSDIVPPEYASTITIVVTVLSGLFAGYVATPQRAAELNAKVAAAE